VTRPRVGLPWPARWAIRAVVGPARHAAVCGDLLELWAIRQTSGRRDLRRALWRDIASIVGARLRRPALAPPLRVPRVSGSRILGVLHMWHDLRYACRVIRRQPAFAVLVAATLALGIAASTAIFTICDRVLLRPLPYLSPDRVVALGRPGFGMSNGHLIVSNDITQSPAFTSVGLYATGGLNFGDESAPARLRAAATSAGFFSALGVSPIMGRPFDVNEERRAQKLAVLSFSTWTTRYGGRRDIIGQPIRLNGQVFTVVGVMPAGFTFPENTEVWIPVFSDEQISGAAFAPLVLGRLAPHVTYAQARDALQRTKDANKAHNPWYRPAEVTPLQAYLTSAAKPTLLFLAAAVALLLIATAANVAGVLLSRLRARQRELLVRSALGASRTRLVGQLMIESLVLTALGGAVGLGFAVAAVRTFAAAAPAFAPNVNLLSIDTRFLAIGLAVMLLTGLLFALVPAVMASRRSAAGVLREGVTTTDRSGWLKSSLVLAQIAAALVLLTAMTAALAMVVRLTRVDLGFDNAHAMVFELTLPHARYANNEAIVRVIDQITGRLGAARGVAEVGASSTAPGSSAIGIGVPLEAAERPEPPEGDRPSGELLAATPDYFRALGIPVLAGRPFTPADRAGAPDVAVLSASAATLLWRAPALAIGKRVRTKLFRDRDYKDVELEVVGVVGDTRLRGVVGQAFPQIYRPFAQAPPFGTASVAVGAMGDPAAIVAAVRDTVREVDADLPPYNVSLVRNVRAQFLVDQRLTLALTSAFAIIALALSAIGLYGVLSQIVTQRTREIGIRMALGADGRRLRLGIMVTGIRLALGGAAVGALASGLAWRAIARFVPALSPPSLRTVAMDAVVLLGVAVLATWMPARRASGVDPLIALRAE
jgi:putative ABC transport system permease protein